MANIESVDSLRPLLQPRSVAIVGASRTEGKSGRIVVQNLIRSGFPGRIYPINPTADEIEGLKCYASIDKVPEQIDCAMLVIPARDMVQAARQCSEAGVRSVIAAASGFSETGIERDIRRQEELTDIARSSGMRLLGPNTNGVLNTVDDLQFGYNSEYRERIPKGCISMISHSGALFSGIARSLRDFGVGLCKFIPVGNEADIDMLDLLAYLIRDPQTRVIGLVMEGLSDGARLRKLAAEAQATGKPIVALKVGRSSVGIEAALAHSSRLAGSSRAYDALFDACNIASVRTVEGLAGGCALLAGRTSSSVAGDQRLVCVTTSGAGGALLADFADEAGLQLAGDSVGEWDGTAAARITALPARGRIRNPIDMGSLDAGWLLLQEVFSAIETDKATGPSAVFTHLARQPEMDDALLRALVERKTRTGKPVMVVAPGGLTTELEARYRSAGMPVFRDISTGFESLKCHYATLGHGRASPSLDAEQAGVDKTKLQKLVRANLPATNGALPLSETDSAEILRAAGLPMVSSTLVRTPEDAKSIAVDVGYPVVCKALAPGVAHKNALGHVVTDIRDEASLLRAVETLEARIAEQGFDRRQVALIIQPMVRSQLELIMGVSCEPGLGHFLLIGLGGIYTEAFDEATLFSIPSSEQQIRERLEASRIGRVLAHMKPEHSVVSKTVDALLALQNIIVACGPLLHSVDVNPFLVGEHCLAVDALIVPENSKAAATG